MIMGKRLQQALAETDEIEAAEANQTDRPLPPHVKVSRPGLARSKVLQVRLNPEEFDAIEQIAADRGLPASTVAREQLLAMIKQAQCPAPFGAHLAEELDAAVEHVRELLLLVPTVTPRSTTTKAQ